LPWVIVTFFNSINIKEFISQNMATNEELERRIEILKKEVQHLKAVLQYQKRNKKK